MVASRRFGGRRRFGPNDARTAFLRELQLQQTRTRRSQEAELAEVIDLFDLFGVAVSVQ